jgi:hypothetical protein
MEGTKMTPELRDPVKSSMQELSTDVLLSIWRVNDRHNYTSAAFAAIADSPHSTKLTLGGLSATNVVITGIKMPFWSMVEFMVRWTFASAVAAILVGVPFFIVYVLLVGLRLIG